MYSSSRFDASIAEYIALLHVCLFSGFRRHVSLAASTRCSISLWIFCSSIFCCGVAKLSSNRTLVAVNATTVSSIAAIISSSLSAIALPTSNTKAIITTKQRATSHLLLEFSSSNYALILTFCQCSLTPLYVNPIQ